jgi:NADH-quinone oxidoreductase subunit D
MKVQVPKRAEYIRIIMAEFNRIASHLIFFGTYGIDIGAFTPFFYAFRDREKILNMFESACGARLTYNYFRIGGVSQDVPEDFRQNAADFVAYFRPKLKEYDVLLSENPIFKDRTVGICPVSAEEAVNWAWSGPNARASGVNYDVRKDDPYSVYNEFDFDIPVGKNGDCWDRYMVRMKEMFESTRIIEQAVSKMQEGDILAKVPKVIKPPSGEVYSRIEAPKGELGIYLISDGSQMPYRMKIRGPSFVNLAMLQKILKGWKIADVVAALGSIDIVLGEVDR